MGNRLKAVGWSMHDEPGLRHLIFYRVHPAGVDGYTPLPYPAEAVQADTLASGWQIFVDRGKQPDHDGKNGKGFRLYYEEWRAMLTAILKRLWTLIRHVPSTLKRRDDGMIDRLGMGMLIGSVMTNLICLHSAGGAGMRIYRAARYSRLEELNGYAGDLRAMGHRWSKAAGCWANIRYTKGQTWLRRPPLRFPWRHGHSP